VRDVEMNRLVRGLLLLALVLIALYALLYVALSATPTMFVIAIVVLAAAVVGMVKVWRSPVKPAAD
jgi:hypothetical protein